MDVSELTRPTRVSQFVISPRKSADTEAVTALPARPKCQYRPGQRVYHQKFGYGVIQEVYLSGTNYNASIQFNIAGLKKLVLGIAPLHIVQS